MVSFELNEGLPRINDTFWTLEKLQTYRNDTENMDEEPLTIILVNKYCILPIVLFGTIGNVLSIAVFRCTKLRRVSASCYLTMLSISDTGFLLTLLVSWLDLLDVPALNQQFLCQFLNYLTYVCSFLSSWLIVAFTVERFVATCYPLWRAVICTVTRAKAIVAGLVCVASMSYLYIPFLVGYEAKENDTMPYCCEFKLEYKSPMKVLHILDMVFTLMVPTILIIVLNVQIVRAIWHFEHVRRRMTMASLPSDECKSSSIDMGAVQLNSNVGKGTHAEGKQGKSCNYSTQYQVKITKMLLIISSVFIGLNAPSYVVRIMYYVMTEEEFVFGDLHHYFMLCYDLNFAINFLLYCVSGQNFRKSLKGLLCKMAHKAKHRQLSRSNTGTMIATYNNSTVSNNTMAIGLLAAYQTSVKNVSVQEVSLNEKNTPQ